ncbi:MAG: PatB family C-S lyase [Spirochaetales bacterium]|nr:PatB family C-S lyase [Spirochaetales bacterium]
MKLPKIDKLSLKWKKSLRDKQDIIPLWIADMDFPCSPGLVQTLKDRAENGIYGYTMAGDGTYDAFIDWTEKRHGWKIEREWIRLVPGVVPALHNAIRAFTNPGNSVIVQTPVYFPFFSAIENNDRQILRNPLLYGDGSYTFDFEQLEMLIHGHTKLFMLCNPHNPVGRVWKADELKKLSAFCIKFGLIILSDEIHCDLVFDGHRHLPLALAAPEILPHLAAFYAPGKTFNCAGLQAAAAVIPDKRMRQLYDDVLLSNGYHMNNCFSLSGFEAAYANGGPWLDGIMTRLAANRARTVSFFRDNFPDIRVIEPEGTYLLWLDCTKMGMPSEDICRKLAVDGGVEVSNGARFEGEGFIRLNFACPADILDEALTRIKKILQG